MERTTGSDDRVELLWRTFGSEIVCPNCGGAIRLMALVKTERTKAIVSIAEVSPMKLKEEVDLEWSEEPQEWADTLEKRRDLARKGYN